MKCSPCLQAGEKPGWTAGFVEKEQLIPGPPHSLLPSLRGFLCTAVSLLGARGFKKLQSDKSIMKWKPRLQPVCLIV